MYVLYSVSVLYSEFCGDNLTRYRFTRAVNKLNTNILHLCFSQVRSSQSWDRSDLRSPILISRLMFMLDSS